MPVKFREWLTNMAALGQYQEAFYSQKGRDFREISGFCWNKPETYFVCAFPWRTTNEEAAYWDHLDNMWQEMNETYRHKILNWFQKVLFKLTYRTL